MTRRSLTPFALTLLLLAAGCGGGDAPAGTAAAADPTEAVQDITLGAGLGTDGAVELGWARDDFPLGDPIYLAMDVSRAQENAEIEVRWIGPDGRVLAHQVRRALPDRKVMSWKAPEEVTLAGDGQYRVKVLYQGAEVETRGFRITGYRGESGQAAGGPSAG